jgi:DNA-binding NtrC family response regulator
MLGIQRSTLQYKLQKYGLDTPSGGETHGGN